MSAKRGSTVFLPNKLLIPEAYKGKECSTAVFARVISESKVCRHALLLLETWAFLCALWLATGISYHPCFVMPDSS